MTHRHNRPQNPKPPKRLPLNEKGSPDSLRRTFLAIRNTAADGNPMGRPEFRNVLDQAWQKDRFGISRIGDFYYRASEDGAHNGRPLHLEYWLMEAYARHLSIPLGVILLVSRLTSHIRHVADKEEPSTPDPLTTDQIIKGTRAVCDYFEQKLREKNVIDDDDIRALIATFCTKQSDG